MIYSDIEMLAFFLAYFLSCLPAWLPNRLLGRLLVCSPARLLAR
jgi:hypothetical protein